MNYYKKYLKYKMKYLKLKKNKVYNSTEVTKILDYIKYVMDPIYKLVNGNMDLHLCHITPQEYKFHYDDLYLSFYCREGDYLTQHITGQPPAPHFIINKIKYSNLQLLLIFLYFISDVTQCEGRMKRNPIIVFSDNLLNNKKMKHLDKYLMPLDVFKRDEKMNYIYENMTPIQKKLIYIPKTINNTLIIKYLTDKNIL